MSVSQPGLLKAILLAARPKTLTASLVPILVSSCLVRAEGEAWQFWITGLALLGAIFIQIATNLINDSLDFKKGADTETRLGEARITSQRWMSPKAVMGWGVFFLFAALLCGIPLVIHGGLPILLIGLASLFLAYGYTGGPYPLAYKGWGDLFVILFFGVIAVGGVYFLHANSWGSASLVAGLQVGLLATVLIAINNIRDMNQDILVNKRTLAVRLGARWARFEIPVLILGAYLLNFYWAAQGWWAAVLLPLLISPLAWKLTQQVLNTAPSREYNRFLAKASLLHLSFGLLLSAGLLFA
jgi:1,4-dihydroxy-2-naphthoate octaprenyltransferase